MHNLLLNIKGSDWIRSDSSPFNAMMLYSGAGLGLVIGLTSPLLEFHNKLYRTTHSWMGLFVGVFMGLTVGQTVRIVEWCLPRDFQPIFLACQLLLHGVYVYMLVTQIPRIQFLIDSFQDRATKLRA